MGATQSISHAHPPSRALHILRVTPSSPASRTNIEPFFDFVVGFEGDALSSGVDVSELEKIVEDHEEQVLNLLVWNSKHQSTRVVPVIPSRSWLTDSRAQHANGNEIESKTRPSLLGLSMRVCEPDVAMDIVWHVLDVLEGSPAESAGLVPYGDWVVGWSGGVLSAENDFYDLVEDHIDKPLRIYVYSYDFDTLREVVLVPNRQWGGEGLLGCVFGFGLLHRIPSAQERTSIDGVDTQHDGEGQESTFVANSDDGLPTTPRTQKRLDTRHPPHSPDDPQPTFQTSSHQSDSRYSHYTGHIHPHPHHHHHDHDHDHEEPPFSNQTYVAQKTPRKSFPTHSMPTSFSATMNGPATARLLSPRASTPIAGIRSPLSFSQGVRQGAESHDSESDDDDHDGELSVASTEPGSDTHSLGSLTSVE